jgi:hypothetical protein
VLHAPPILSFNATLLSPNVLHAPPILFFNHLIGWQLSIWNCCKPFFSLLYNCQLLCFRRLALSIAVKVFPQPS